MTVKSDLQNEEIASSFKNATAEWVDETTIQCKGATLQLTQGLNFQHSAGDAVTLFKDTSFVDDYIRCLKELKVENVVELGVKDGGSAILFWNLLKPSKFSCIELNSSAPQLTRYIQQEGLDDKISTFFGVDQADKQKVSEIIRDQFSTEPLDLVIDDASHMYYPSLASFEALFPQLRPGGLYILEDWKVFLLVLLSGKESLKEEPPLHQLVHELVELSVFDQDIVSSVACFRSFVVIERGAKELQVEDFSVPRLMEKYKSYY
jgi:hypothetical protein